MLRVGMDARWHNSSGVGSYVRLLLDGLAGLPDGDFEIIAYQFADLPVPIDSPRIRKVSITGGKYSIAGQWQLARRCQADRIDVFHAPFYIVPMLAPCPIVCTIHDLMPFLFPIYGFLHQETVKLGYRAGARRSARVIAISGTTAKDLVNLLHLPQHKLAVINNSYPSKLFHDRGSSDERDYLRRRYGIRDRFVLTMSANNWRTKNLPVAVRAMAFAQEHSTVVFQPVVAGAEAGYRQSGCDGLLKDAVITGFVPDEDLPKLYRNAAAFLTVSLYEGFGFPLVEAMACGCPCIISMGGSLPEVAGNAAPSFECSDFEGMGQTLLRLLEDQEHAQKARRLGLARAASFSGARMAQQTLDLYRATASSHPR
jgi:glycosyltransferase involved in cell wall biosynthesis